ncbi:hypothetical protein [Streptomyces sp. SID5643]|uniref:hypothetical protein n=1 Tax=Streptomyces sp. SID5643 TaxID=2690307 RepID=UPI001370BD39|nr:hypothetical protein [Streptomyces sp. SID5643]MZF90958.1 hypothetical protein [Streptomyces sp. SID5643]
MRIFRRLGLALSGWVAAAFATLPDAAPPRLVVVTAFLLVCPGLAALRWARPPGAVADPRGTAVVESCVLTLVLSLTLSIVVAETLFLARAFTPARALLILAALTTLLVLLPPPGRRRRVRRRPAGKRPEAAEEGR